MSSWTPVADLDELPVKTLRRIDVNGTAILLVRDGHRLFALGANCPHAGAPLEKGALCNGRLVCPWHKAVFAIGDGRVLEPPALESLPAWPVRVEGTRVSIDAEARARVTNGSLGSGQRIAIIGGGAAGASAIAALHEAGFDGEATLFAAEPEPPYDRTTLSKFVPAGEMAPDDVPPLLPRGVVDDAHLRIDHTRVERLDVPARRLALADGREAAFDAVLVASGGVARRPDVPGADGKNVHVLRTLRDAASVLAALAPGDHAAILGNSFIGLETASALRKRGVGVTLIAPHCVPLLRPLGARVGALFRELHEAHGTKFLQGEARHIDDTGVTLADGRHVRADAVIAGLGVRPATDFVEGITRDDDGGLAVDATLRVAEGVYAAGDIAAFPIPGSRERGRIEHWRVAQQHGRVAALNMIGEDAHYTAVPFFWTFHYGRRFDYVGHVHEWDEVVINGRLDGPKFVALYARFGRVKAVLALGCEQAMATLVERMREPLALEEACSLLAI